jgi:hypothetical protein
MTGTPNTNLAKLSYVMLHHVVECPPPTQTLGSFIGERGHPQKARPQLRFVRLLLDL